VGTISYWNGSGVSTMSPPSAGASIPVANLVNYTSNGWRYDITATLASNPSSYTQVPANAPLVGTADRTEAKAVLGAPVAGKITYKLTNTTTGNVVVDLTMDVDLGSLTATAVYKP
jgi:tetrahydromethanopterin S-methyltransferase subunit E